MSAEKKVFKTRDQSTAALRKLGVKKEKYGDFIFKTSIGTFIVNLDAARASLLPAAKPAAPAAMSPTLKALAEPVVKPVSQEAAPKEKPAKKPRVTVASAVRSLVGEGRTNEEIWAAIKKQFNLDEGKRWYPGWYRAEMRRKNVV